MKMITDEKVNFNSLEENTYKKVMKLGRELIIDNLRTLDNLYPYELNNLGKK